MSFPRKRGSSKFDSVDSGSLQRRAQQTQNDMEKI